MINEKGAAPAKGPAIKSSGPTPAGTSNPNTRPAMSGSRSQLDALIGEVGRTPPEWFEATALNYPTTSRLW